MLLSGSKVCSRLKAVMVHDGHNHFALVVWS